MMVVAAVLINFTSKGITETVLLKSEEARVKERMFDIERLLYERYLDVFQLAGNQLFLHAPSALPYVARDWLGVEILDKDKKVKFSSFDKEREGQEFSGAEFEGDFSYGDAVEPEYLGKKTLIFRKNIQKDGVLAGYLIGYFDWRRIEEIVEQEKDVGIHLLDGNFNQMATNEDEEDVELDKKGGLFEKVKEKKQGSFIGPGLGDKPSVVSYIRQEDYLELPTKNWVLIFESPLSVSYVISQKATVQMLLALAFLVFIEGIAIWFFISVGIANPLSHLTSLATKMAGGDLKERARVELNDEIGELSGAFNDMADKLSATYASLEQKVVERTQQLNLANAELEKKQLALMNVLEDVSKEKAYKEKESQSLLQILGEGIVITNEKGEIAYVNPAFERLLGFSAAEIAKKTLREITRALDLKDKPLPYEILSEASAVSKESQGAKMQLVKKDGAKAAVITTASPIYVSQEYKGIIRLFHDYSEDLNLQRQKDDFFSIASHELRTPLTIIAGNLDNLAQGYGGSKLSEVDKTLLHDMMNASDRLIAMVNDFLNVSRLEQGRIQPAIATVDLCQLTEKVVEEIKPTAHKKNLYIKYYCDRAHGKVLGDEDKLREVLLNVIGNSLKFTKEGGVTIAHKVEKDMLITTVTDTGMGIAKERQSLLFQRFQQAMERTLAREAGGTGLGLYISREFIRLMGGDLWLVESIEGKGSSFAFKIPLLLAKTG